MSAQQIGIYTNVALSKITDGTDFFRAKSIGVEYHFNTDRLVNFSLNGAYEEKGYNLQSLGDVIKVRLEYYNLKGLAKIGNESFDAQIGIYMGILGSIEEYYNGVLQDDEQWYARTDAGLSAIINQRLFSTGPISYHLRGEANYGIFTIQSSSIIDFKNGDRNLNVGLGLSARWNFKEK